MKKYDELLQAIEGGEMGLAKELAIELYNDVRDFSQSIMVVNEQNGTLIITNDKYASPEFVSEKKKKVQVWVGGH